MHPYDETVPSVDVSTDGQSTETSLATLPPTIHPAEVVQPVKRVPAYLAELDEAALSFAIPQAEADAARELATTQHTDHTLRCYRYDWNVFSRYCAERKVDPWTATPAAVATYLAWLATSYGAKRPTVERALAGIAYHLRQVDPDQWIRGRSYHECVRAVLRGMRRKIPHTPRQAVALLADDVWRILAAIPRGDWHDLRDRALILLAFVSACRGDELTALRVSDAVIEPEGIRLRIRRSKTDQEWHGLEKPIPYSADPDGCPVRVLFEWLDAAHLESEDPMFPALVPCADRVQEPLRPIRPVAYDNIVRKHAKRAGIEAHITSHSARAGFITEAARQGRPLDRIMRQSGHTRIDTLMRYIRPATLFEGSAASGILEGGEVHARPAPIRDGLLDPAPMSGTPVSVLNVRKDPPAPTLTLDAAAPVPIPAIEHNGQRLVRLDREALRKERETRDRAKRLREEEARTSERARSAADQARALASRGYSVDQIARALTRGLALDVTPADVQQWLEAR